MPTGIRTFVQNLKIFTSVLPFKSIKLNISRSVDLRDKVYTSPLLRIQNSFTILKFIRKRNGKNLHFFRSLWYWWWQHFHLIFRWKCDLFFLPMSHLIGDHPQRDSYVSEQVWPEEQAPCPEGHCLNRCIRIQLWISPVNAEGKGIQCFL